MTLWLHRIRILLYITSSGDDLDKYSGNFWLAPRWKINWPGEFNFFYISPVDSLNLVLITGAKSDDHRGT